MEYACSPFVPLGVLFPARRGDPFTATVKLSYDISSGGWARPSQVPDPIVEAAFGPHPCDLLGVKQACDVALVGWATQEPGPVAFGAAGRMWSRASASLGAAQVSPADAGLAPHDQRIPFPAQPFEVFFESATRRLRAMVPGPPPAIGLVHFSTWHAMRALPIALDGVLIDPARAVVNLTFRAIFSHDGDPDRDLTLVVYPAGDDRRPRVSDLSMWPTFTCPAKRSLDAAPESGGPRRGYADDEDTSTGIALPVARPAADEALPFARPVAATAPVGRALAPALPFAQAPSAGAERPAQTLVDESSTDDGPDTLPPGPDTLPPSPSDTPPDAAAQLPPAPPALAPEKPDFAPALVAPPALWAPPIVAHGPYEPVAAPPPAPAPPPPPPPAPPPAPAPERRAARGEDGALSEEEVAAVRAELWTFPDRRREILRDRGLTESGWRSHEERFGGKSAPDVAAIMRSVSRRPPIAWRKS